MKIKSKIISFLFLGLSLLGGYSFTWAQSAYIVQNPNNQNYFSNSAYGRNYYANNQGVNYNRNSPCYGQKACYSANYLKPSYNYSTWYPVYNASYDNSYNNNYQNNYNNFGQYPYATNYNYNNPNQYYSNNYSNPVNVYSVPQQNWSNGNYNYYNYGY